MLTLLKNVLNDQHGSAFIENGLWIALVTLVIVAALGGVATAISNGLSGLEQDIQTHMPAVTGG